jgi:glycine cleavage system H lipoate-binding protein
MVTLESIGVLVVGLLIRFGILLLVLAVLAVIFFIGLGLVRGFGAAWQTLAGLSAIEGLWWRRGLYYAPGHTWVRWQGARALRVGLDDLAQRLLPSVSAVTLPAPGARLGEGQVASEIMCGEKRARIVSPVEGTVTAVNPEVAKDPSLIHRDPYRRGWLFTVDAADTRYTRLPYGNEARNWFRDEAVRLAHFLERELGVAAADGGELLAPGPAFLRSEQWDALTSEFLKSPAGEPRGAK